MEDNYIMIKKRLFKFTSVFMCAAMMAVSFAACGTNTASVNDTNSVAYEQSKSGDARAHWKVLSTSSFLEHLSQMFQQ